MADPIWDRDRDGPGVVRYGSIVEAIERMPMEEFVAMIVALSRAAKEKQEEGS
jgi:hypothetical protein